MESTDIRGFMDFFEFLVPKKTIFGLLDLILKFSIFSDFFRIFMIFALFRLILRQFWAS